ncbi:Protein phosphatase 2C 29 [Linum perenne]
MNHEDCFLSLSQFALCFLFLYCHWHCYHSSSCSPPPSFLFFFLLPFPFRSFAGDSISSNPDLLLFHFQADKPRWRSVNPNVMGSGLSSLFPCYKPAAENNSAHQPDLNFAADSLDETLGHSFVYVRSSNRFLSPTPSDRFISPSTSLRFSPTRPESASSASAAATSFKTISGASVSANTTTPRTVIQHDCIYDDGNSTTEVLNSSGNVFESTASFCSLPLQPAPRGGGDGGGGGGGSGGFFLSGPIERGALSGPLDANSGESGGGGGGVHFSAPLGDVYVKRKRRRGIPQLKKAIYRNLSEKKLPWVVPVLNFVNRRENGNSAGGDGVGEGRYENNVQWALGKAGEDRVHVVVSEEQGWLFVGIYDGFNGPDAPEFLMGNLYRAVYHELQGLFWDVEESGDAIAAASTDQATDVTGKDHGESLSNGSLESSLVAVADGGQDLSVARANSLGGTCVDLDSETGTSNAGQSQAEPSSEICVELESNGLNGGDEQMSVHHRDRPKRVTFQSDGTEVTHRRKLWELLANEDLEDGLDLSGSERFAFSVDDAISVGNEGSAASRRWLLLSKLKQGLTKHRERKLFPWKFGLEGKEEKVEVKIARVEDRVLKKMRKEGPVDHDLVLRALSRALDVTELAYLDMTDKVLGTNPELALMGSCLLVVLMRDEDVYVMNVGDSRAIVAQYEPQEIVSDAGDDGLISEAIVEGPAQSMSLTALQLSTDHSTSIEEEVLRIKNEHPDDNQCIVNDRVKGRLKVTRAFGAGFLKQPKLNAPLLEMFRNEYIGDAPYLSCIPSLRHHHLCPRDQFLILSSDGLYQYLTNQEVVSLVESFMEKFPDGDPAQSLIEELLSRAAKKAGNASFSFSPEIDKNVLTKSFVHNENISFQVVLD